MGNNLRTPQTLVYEEWMEEGNTSQSVVEYILQLNNRLKRCQDIAITRMKECQLKRKTWYDRDAVERKFVEGDLVMVLVTSKQNKLEVNWIGPGKRWDSPITLRPLFLVESPNKDPRPCVDYRRLNEITRAEFSLPNMEKIVEKVSAAPYVTVMDLSKGYFQIPLTPRAQRYAAFVTPFGTYIPKKMMFGLVCTLLFLQIDGPSFRGVGAVCIAVHRRYSHFFPRVERSRKAYRHSFRKIEKGGAGLKVKPSKCKFAQEEVLFLGHRIGSGSRSPSDLKIKAIADFPRPTTKTHVRSFLGLVGYYSHYIPNYSTTASPLTDALKGKIKKEKITWDEKCGKAFEELRAKLVTQPILFAPDFATDFILQTDASEAGVGVVLSQRIEGEEHPIVFLSKKFSKAERNYSTVERELAAIIFGLKRLNHYLDGQNLL
ncbi:retrovirus-related Pol polyprotein from transposon 297 [Trichonephila clavipes]|nr:retrovirus-related Pol polyprotein from transposon 297 [Trichonephila clavipes]